MRHNGILTNADCRGAVHLRNAKIPPPAHSRVPTPEYPRLALRVCSDVACRLAVFIMPHRYLSVSFFMWASPPLLPRLYMYGNLYP